MGLLKSDAIYNSTFKSLAEDVASILNTAGLRTKAYHNSSLPLFSNLSEELKKNAIQNLKIYLTTLTATLAAGNDLKNNAKSLWHALKELQLRHSNALFPLLENDDGIEVYYMNGIQIWRNLFVLERCSYTIEELNCYSWDERYERDIKIEKKIMSYIQQLNSIDKDSYINIENCNSHKIKETQSEDKLNLKMNHRFLVPLYGTDDSLLAFVAISKAEIITTNNIVNDVSKSFGNLKLVEKISEL